MKIRIKGNSIRLRLSKSEIDKFGKLGCIEEKTVFGVGTLTYTLLADKSVAELTANFKDAKITVHVPEKIKHDWVTTDQIGFENNQKIDEESSLFILIEKDFVCLDNTLEDQSDNFPNPNAFC